MSNKYFWKKKKFVCRDTGERATGYEDYLKTAHWRQLRERIYQERNGICERCGRELDGVFEVHHKSYKSVGHEEDTSLMLVCPECHEEIHAEMKAKAAATRAKNAEQKQAEVDAMTYQERTKGLDLFTEASNLVMQMNFEELLDLMRFTSMCLADTREYERLFNADKKHLSDFLVWNVVESVFSKAS